MSEIHKALSDMIGMLPEEIANKIIFKSVKKSIDLYLESPNEMNLNAVISGCAFVLETKMRKELGGDVVDKHEKEIKEFMSMMKEAEHQIKPKKGGDNEVS